MMVFGMPCLAEKLGLEGFGAHIYILLLNWQLLHRPCAGAWINYSPVPRRRSGRGERAWAWLRESGRTAKYSDLRRNVPHDGRVVAQPASSAGSSWKWRCFFSVVAQSGRPVSTLQPFESIVGDTQCAASPALLPVLYVQYGVLYLGIINNSYRIIVSINPFKHRI